MSKLSFRARALDAARPLAVWLAEELPELPDYTAISRAVPQMPSGMEKEEECEHHLQRAICTGLIIPTPEVSRAVDLELYERCYPADYKMPKQLIHMQPLCLEQETPEYDMDTEDELWLRQHRHTGLTELKLEEMMDKLEHSSGQTVLQLSEAKLLLQRDDNLVDLVYDYWLNKRLNLQHPLIPSVRTESRAGQVANNPYLAFRRRTEKMQTRKNRKNDESSYEKMVKLRRDLSRAAALLEQVVRRERHKRDLVKIARQTADVRYRASDFAGHLLAELQAAVRPPVLATPPAAPAASATYRRETLPAHYPPVAHDLTRQRDKRQNKRRKHRYHGSAATTIALRAETGAYSSSEEEAEVAARAPGAARAAPEPTDELASPADDGPFAFRRKPGVYYQMPKSSLCGNSSDGSESPTSARENLNSRDKRHRFTLTSINEPYRRCIGFARRRIGRGGRVILDRIHTPLDDLWRRLDFPYSQSSQHDQHTAPDPETTRFRYPHETVRDFSTGGKYPWRHAFREHYAADPTKWNSDSVIVNRQSARRKRRASESSLDSAEELQPHEAEFGKMLEQVNTEWLHFRPRTPPAERPVSPDAAARVELAPDVPLSVQVLPVDEEPPSRLLTDYTTFTTSEFTLSDLYGDVLDDSASPDVSGDDSNLLADNFSGLTDAQVESILSETDLKVLAEDDLKDGRKNSLDLLKPDEADAILEELVQTEVPFLSAGRGADERVGRAANSRGGRAQRRRGDGFGSTTVTVVPLDSEPIVIDASPPEPVETPRVPTPVKPEPQPPPKVQVKPPVPAVTPPVAQTKPEVKRKPFKEEILEDIQVAQGVQLKTVHTKHSPLKKHIISATRRNEPITVTSQPQENPPQIVTVSVSEGLKARLQSHLLATSGGQVVTLDAGSVSSVVGLMQNGPFTVSAASGVASVAVSMPTASGTITVPGSREGVLTTGVASTSSPRRLPAPLVHLTPTLHQKQIISTASTPVVVTHSPHTLQHVAPNKLKVLHAHTLTQQQRSQLLAASQNRQMPAVVSLASLGETKSAPSTPLQLKTTQGTVAQFYEIKSGQLGKPHVVNVVRQPQPGKTTVARLDLNDAKKRGQVVATFDGTTLKGNISTAPRPHRVSVLDGRQLVRAALPTVRAHQVRHQIQLKNRTLVASPQQQHPASITIAATSKTTSLPNSVVANLLQKNVMGKGGQKIAISGSGAPLSNVQAFATFTHAQQLKARQARLVAQPRSNANVDLIEVPTTSGVSASALPSGNTAGDADTTTNGGVRRRGDNLPMEVT